MGDDVPYACQLAMRILASSMEDRGESGGAEPKPDIIDRTPDHLLCSWRHMLFVVWRRHTTLGAVHKMGKSLEVLALQVRRSVDLLIVAEEMAAAPQGEVRAPIAQVLKTAPIAQCAVAFEGDGFRAAALRAFATGIGLVARPPFPYRSFASVAHAARWFESGQPDRTPLPAESIERAVRVARGP